MSEQTNAAAPGAVAAEDGVIVVNGEKFMRDAQFRLVPVDLVKPADRLIDELVRKMLGHADTLSAQMGRFKVHGFDDIASVEGLLAQEYGAQIGGRKGNITLTTVDGCRMIKVQVQDQIAFGPELQAAKALVDECVSDWASGARSEIRVLVEHAFQVDQEGKINRTALFQLRRIEIEDERWVRAMEAISDSIRVIGSKTYLRFYKRDHARAQWQMVPLDLAAEFASAAAAAA